MKRSEMIKIIKDNIPGIDMDTYAQQEMDLEKGAENILTAIEKAGMKPPIRKSCPVLYRETYVWEDENA